MKRNVICATASAPDKKEVIIKALQKNLGNVAQACKSVHISRVTFYEWCKSPEFKRRVEDVREELLDFAESKLFELMERGDTTAVIFYLKTKGKGRGYTERQEIDFAKLEPPKIEICFEQPQNE